MTRLTTLRQSISQDARAFLQHIWDEYQAAGEWPTTWMVNSRFHKSVVLELLRGLDGNYVVETESGEPTYRLEMIGVVSTAEGSEFLELLERYLDFARTSYLKDPRKKNLTHEEVSAALNLDEGRTRTLGRLVSLTGIFGASMSHGANAWSAGIPRQVEDFPRTGSLRANLEDLLLRNYQSASPILAADRRQRHTQSIPDLGAVFGLPTQPVMDPLRRIYQVFVSSTYVDLQVERQHVMHALLQTRCVPVGMEFFPASSTDQLELIKPLIDDADYYVIIVGGRYGSCPKGGKISFTELEFDYAVSRGKYIIGLCHRDIDQLTGNRLEKSDEARMRLSAFRDKVMSGRVCDFWTSPDELGSKVKTAMFHALMHFPQRGWVRAPAVAGNTSPVLQIPAAERKRPSSEDIQLPLRAKVSIVTDPKNKWDRIESKEHSLDLTRTLDQLLVILAKRLEKPAPAASLKKSLEHRLAQTLPAHFQKTESREVLGVQCTMPSASFERIIDKLHDRSFISMKTAPKGSKVQSPRWQITSTGAKHLSGIRANTDVVSVRDGV